MCDAREPVAIAPLRNVRRRRILFFHIEAFTFGTSGTIRLWQMRITFCFSNAGEGYQVSHPMIGGDSSLSVSSSAEILRELAPSQILSEREALGFGLQHQRIDPRA
jgi:hypothetical protein